MSGARDARGPGRRQGITLSELLAEADRTVPSVSPKTAMQLLSEMPETVVLDVRDPHEFAQCHIGRAVNLSRGQLEFHIDEVLKDQDHPVLLVDKAGARSLLAGKTLQIMGYTRVFALAGGLEAWIRVGLPVESAGRTAPRR